MQDKYKIDLSTRLAIDTVHPSLTGEDIIETPCTESFYLPKWNGESWEEGATQGYIDNLKAQAEPQAPTVEEMVIALVQTQAELEATTEALDFLIMGGI